MTNRSHQGHTARKRFGQNFLVDEDVIDRIVRAIRPLPGERVVEIGPGLAALTRPLAEEAERLQVIELDRDLATRLAADPQLGPKLNIHQADALRFDFAKLAAELGGPLRVCGNLPYNISTPLIFHLLSQHSAISDMHFMLQKEVVERLAAAPGCADYGRLTVMVQYHCFVEPVLMVPPGAFLPPPKVESAVVRLIPHQQKPVVASNEKLLSRICAEAFTQRRKTLRNSLGNWLNDDDFSALGINSQLRPENLSVADYVAIANYQHAKQNSGAAEATK